jgi:hypothetical protein
MKEKDRGLVGHFNEQSRLRKELEHAQVEKQVLQKIVKTLIKTINHNNYKIKFLH